MLLFLAAGYQTSKREGRILMTIVMLDRLMTFVTKRGPTGAADAG
jgi:hypothetical protein